MSPNSSPERIAANRANALKSTGPKTPEGKARSAFNGLVHGLRAETVVLPGEDVAKFAAIHAAMYEEHAPETATEYHLVDTMTAAHWAIDRARRHETVTLTRKLAEAYAKYDAEHGQSRPQARQPRPEPVPLHEVPWVERCAVGAARVKQMPEGRQLFLERWRFLREQFINTERATRFLDEALLMLGHRASELVEGVPLVEEFTLDWVSLWFEHRPPTWHRVSDVIRRCSSLHGPDLDREIARLTPKLLPYPEALARLLGVIDGQIAELEAAQGLPDPEPDPPPPEPDVPGDSDEREAACAYALFDSSPEAALRLRYITAQENTYSRALRNLLALRKQRGAERPDTAPTAVAAPSPTEATPDATPEANQPTEASAEGVPEGVWEPIPVETPLPRVQTTRFEPTSRHSRR